MVGLGWLKKSESIKYLGDESERGCCCFDRPCSQQSKYPLTISQRSPATMALIARRKKLFWQTANAQ